MVAEVEGLETALVDLAREAKELDATQVHKDQLLAEHDNHFAHGARTLEALSPPGRRVRAGRVRWPVTTRCPGGPEQQTTSRNRFHEPMCIFILYIVSLPSR